VGSVCPYLLAALSVALQQGWLAERSRRGPGWPREGKSQNLRRNSSLWISLEQVSEVRRKSLTLKAKLRGKPVDNPVGGS
jgi:hypothetical protein